MKSETEIRKRIDELDERHRNFSERTRMSADGRMVVMLMSELHSGCWNHET